VLAARAGTTVDDAFHLIRRHARGAGIQLTSVAEGIVRGRIAAADVAAQSDNGC
jgi:hypothetical protein